MAFTLKIYLYSDMARLTVKRYSDVLEVGSIYRPRVHASKKQRVREICEESLSANGPEKFVSMLYRQPESVEGPPVIIIKCAEQKSM